MTRAATAGELTKLRSNGQWARWKVLIDRPDVIYTAVADGSLSTLNYSVSFTGGSGTLTNVKKDMTILFGTTSGGLEHGIGRIRQDSQGGDTYFYLGGDPSLLVADNDYITILNDFAPMSKHPYEDLIDVDVAYSDQFTNFIPVPIFTERVAVIDAGDTIGFDASTSWVPGSTISGYSWTFTGATSSTGTTTATPTATYNTSGRYKVALTLTAANAKTAIGYGWVYVLGDNLSPETGCIVSDVEGESEIGWACRVRAYDRPTIKDKVRVIIYADDYYANALGSIGPVTGRENIVMVGWIIGETIIREPGQDYVEFTVGGPGVVCSNIATLPAGLTHANLPTDSGATLPAWAKMTLLTHRKGLHYMINYRSTLATVMDVTIEDWTWPAHKLTTDDETLWGQLGTFAKHGLLQCTSDRYAHLYIQRDAAYYPIDDRSADIPVVMTFGDSDWTDELSINRRQTGEVSIVEAEGMVFNESTRRITPAGGRAPGLLPGSHGTVYNISEINWDTWLRPLEIAGLIMGQKCTEYESIGVIHPANNRFIDVAPRQYVNVVVDGSTLRTIPRRVSHNRDDEGQITTELELEPEGPQYPAANIEYPGENTPPVTPPVVPPVPPPPPPEEPPTPETPSAADAVVVTSDDVRITADLDEASPTWTSIISGGPTTPIDSDLSEIDNDILFVIEADTVWKCTGVTGTPAWAEMWTGTDLTGGTIGALTRIRLAPGSSTLVYVLGYGETGGTDNPFVLRSANGGDTWTESWLSDELPEETPYTVTHEVLDIHHEAGGTTYYYDIPHERNATSDAGTYSPWAMAFYYSTQEGTDAIGTASDANSILDATQGSPVDQGIYWGHHNDLLDSTDSTTADGWMTDYFGSWSELAGINRNMPNAANRVNFRLFSSWGAWDFDTTLHTYVFWNAPNQAIPTALDVSRTNSNYVYVGTPNKVWKSIDGGFNWTQSLDHGSNDIHVDPQLAGAYYHWARTGSLELVVADVVNATLDTEGAVETPLRLARDLNSGRLWALADSTTLEMRNLGSWTSQDTGLSNARGLHAYLGGKLIYLDATQIMYSGDYGATQADKIGDFATYASPINAHLMRSE